MRGPIALKARHGMAEERGHADGKSYLAAEALTVG